MKPRRISVSLTAILLFCSILVPQPVHAADCDLAGLPMISSTGINQENCDFDTTKTPNFIEFQKRILSEARANRNYVDTRLQKVNVTYSGLPKPGELVSLGTLQERVKLWEAEKDSLQTRIDSLVSAAKGVIENSQKNALNRSSSLYDWLLNDNRNDISLEEWKSKTPQQEVSIVNYEVQITSTPSNTPLYIRTTIKSVSPYSVIVDFTSYTSVSGVLNIKRSTQKLIDRREQISFKYATQWAQGLKWEVGDPVYLDDEGSIALVEKRWLSNGELYETWLTRVNYPKDELSTVEFYPNDRGGGTVCLRILLAGSEGGASSCPKVLLLTRNQAKTISKSSLESDFKKLYQMYQDSQALALILGKEYVRYPDYMSIVADELLLEAERISGQAFKLKEDIKAEVDSARKAEIDAAVLKAKQEAEAKAKAEAAKKKATITCVKGKKVKKVTAINPKCPKGYKKK